jgi:mono/diheme cytochrome c family protein
MTSKLGRGIFVLLILAALVGLSAAPAVAQEQSKIRTTPIRGSVPFSGQELYTELCAACHGASGHGDGPAAAALKTMPTDLTQLAKQAGGKFPSLAVRRFIEGADALAAHGSREMPIWGQAFRSLSVDNPQAQAELRITNLTKYIESIQAK